MKAYKLLLIFAAFSIIVSAYPFESLSKRFESFKTTMKNLSSPAKPKVKVTTIKSPFKTRADRQAWYENEIKEHPDSAETLRTKLWKYVATENEVIEKYGGFRFLGPDYALRDLKFSIFSREEFPDRYLTELTMEARKRLDAEIKELEGKFKAMERLMKFHQNGDNISQPWSLPEPISTPNDSENSEE